MLRNFLRPGSHRPGFIVVNALVIGLAYLMWRVGILTPFDSVDSTESVLVSILAVYWVVGMAVVWNRKWILASHISNQIPILALVFTVLGLFHAATMLKNFDPQTLLETFRAIIFALLPNLAGVTFMWWLREVAMWGGRESL